MVEYERTQDRESPDAPRIKICVAGIGGGGLNVLDRICLDRLMDATLVGMHTDVRVLGHAMAPVKIQLGAEMMRGIGCGGDPELGHEAAAASREQIKAALQGHEMIFICTGLGGGTGSGAAPVVAEVAKELGALVFVFATVPFSFEGRRRLTQAEVALEELQRSADALILFENNRMGELILPKEGIQKAFSQADQLIGHSVRAIATMVTQPGIVRVGLADLMSALRSPNARCLFGFGEARGANRVSEALKRALKSPLVNQGLLLQNAKNLLVHIAGGETLALAEVDALMKQLGKHVPDDTQIMFGLAVDPKLGDLLSVTLISSLSAQDMALESATRATQRLSTRPVDPAKPLAMSEPAPVRAELNLPLAAATPAASSNGVHISLRPESVPAPAAAPVQPVTPPAPPPAPSAVPDLFAQAVEAPAPPAPRPAPVEPPAPAPASVASEWFAGDHVPLSAHKPAPAAAPVPPEPPPAPPVAAPVAATAPERPVSHQAPPAPEPPVRPAPQPRPQPSPVSEAPPSMIKSSIFSIVDDEEEEEPDASHWAEKYIHAKPDNHKVPPVVEPRREPLRPAKPTEQVLVTAAPVSKAAPEPRQPALKLNQDEVARFKGTDKTIVDGDDLDVPTWMRMRKKGN